MFSLAGLFRLFSSTADEALSAAGAPRFFAVNGGEGDQNSSIHLHLHTTAPVTIVHATSASSVEHTSRAGSAEANAMHSGPRQRIQPLRRRRSQDARANIMRAAGQQGAGHGANIQRRAPRPSLSHAGQIRTHPRIRSSIVPRDVSPALSDVSDVSNAATFGGSSRESSPGLILFPLSGPRTGDSLGSGFRSIQERSYEAAKEQGLRLPESVDSQDRLFEALSSLSPASGATGSARNPRNGAAATIPVMQRRKRTRSFIHQAKGYDGDDSDSEFEVDTTRRVRRRLSSSTRIPFASSSEPLSTTHSTSLHSLTAPTFTGVGKGKKRTRATVETDHSSSEEDPSSPTKRPRVVLRPQRKTRPHPSDRAQRNVQASPAVKPGPHGSDASRSSHRLAPSQIPQHYPSSNPSSLSTSSHPSTSSLNSSISASSATSFSSVSSAEMVKEEDMDEGKELMTADLRRG